ncbi:MAG TPA: hypothetical protein VF590_00135, partial [Isosphaeraceae bacterium]
TDPAIGDVDTIAGGAGDDILLGGNGADDLDGGEGYDILLGDSGRIQLSFGQIISISTTDSSLGGNDMLTGGGGNDIAMGGYGRDSMVGDTGRDLLIGDGALVTLAGGLLASIATTDPSIGDSDTLDGGGDDDILLGGAGADGLVGGDGDDILLGDFGRLQLSAGQVTGIATTDPNLGGNDTITGGAGDDIVLGGSGADNLNGGDGDDILLGDFGSVVVIGGVVSSVTSTDAGIGGDDMITGGAGDDVAIGGFGRDSLSGDAWRDVLIGDSATVGMLPTGEVSTVVTTNPDLGGDDSISGGWDDDVILGGAGNDTLTGGTGRDSILGDHGTAAFKGSFNATFNPPLLTSTDPAFGGNDAIKGDEGDDAIIGGTGADRINGGSGNDLIFGDHAHIDLSTLPKPAATSLFIDAGSRGGNDVIHGDADNDTIFGGQGDDTIYGDYGNDALGGGHTLSGGASGFDTVLGGYGSDTPDHDLGAGVPALSHPAFSFQYTADFSSVIPARFTPVSGSWTLNAARYQGTAIGDAAVAPFSLAYVRSTYVELQAIVNVQGTSAGWIFDHRSASDYKFAALVAATGQVVIGHRTSLGLVTDSAVTRSLRKALDYTLAIVLNRNTASVYVNGQLALTYTFADLTTDGQVGLISTGGTSLFDNIVIRGDDTSAATGLSLTAASAAPGGVAVGTALSTDGLRRIGDAAILRWLAIRPEAAELLAGVTFEVADLPGTGLGLAIADTIRIDPTAAGFGWFIDATPLDDSEFLTAGATGNHLVNVPDLARRHIDLLTVVLHELGHVLGLGDLDAHEHPDDLLSETLPPGIRR